MSSRESNSKREVFNQLNLVGLGGTGCNVLSHFLQDEIYVRSVVESPDLRLNMLALDVADGDVNALRDTYNNLVRKLRESGVPQDKVFLRAVTIKFSTPDVLFDFLQNYPNYLRKEGGELKNYKPWIDSKLKIPNLAGGVGRLRSLAKAIYGLNYYHFSQLENIIEEFQNRVSSSVVQPVILMIFGMGGGTGSGIVYELARHIRRKAGSGIPIMAISVLPSNSDDSLAKGPSPFMAMNEFREIFNTDKNRENPFSIMFFVPLQLAITETKDGTLTHAKAQVDEEILNVIRILSSFDLADMLADIGANQNLKDNYINSIGFLKVRYPIEDYVGASYVYLDRLKAMGEVMREKISFFGSVKSYLSSIYSVSLETYRRYLASLGTQEQDLERKVMEIVRRGGKFDADVGQMMRTLQRYFTEDFIGMYDPLLRSMKFPEDSVEASTLSRITSTLSYVRNLSSPDFDERQLEEMRKDLQTAIGASRFTSRQLEVLSQVMDFLEYVQISVSSFKLYYVVRYFLNELSFLLSTSDPTSSQEMRRTIDEELITLLKYVSVVISKAEDEKRSLPQYAGAFQQVRRRYEERVNAVRSEIEQREDTLRRKEEEARHLREEAEKTGIFGRGKRRRLQEELKALEEFLAGERSLIEERRKDMEREREMLSHVDKLLSYPEVTGNLWRALNRLTRLNQEYNSIVSGAVRSQYFFEKVLDLSEAERLRIIAMILSGEEEKLREISTLREIIDLPRLKTNLKGLMRLFGSPSYFGLTPSYRTDRIWAIVSTPEIWDSELEEELKNQLAQYTTVSASLGISVRPIKPVQPWTIELMMVASKAKPEDLDVYQSISANTSSYPSEELRVFRAYRVEEGE